MKGAPGAKDQARELFAHASVAGGVGVQRVRQIPRIVSAEQTEAVKVMEVGIAARVDRFFKEGPDSLERQGAVGNLRCAFEGPELPVAVRAGCPGIRLRARAEDGRDEQDRGVGAAFAKGVDEAVQQRLEYPLTHGIQVHDVDADLDADAVGGEVTNSARDERVDVR